MKLNRVELGSIVSGAIVALLCGCADTMHHGEDFQDSYQGRSVWQAMNKQAALGAHDEATLHAADFDGDKLSSLGVAHLEAMMDEKPAPAVVYVALDGHDSMTAARQNSVVHYLSQMQMAGTMSPHVEVGMNPGSHTMAVDAGSRMDKTENPSSKSDGFGSNAQGFQSSMGGGTGSK